MSVATAMSGMDDELSERIAIDRRRLLALSGVGLTAGIAGCGSSDDGDDPDDADDPEPDDPEPDDGDDDDDADDTDDADESDEADDEDGEDDGPERSDASTLMDIRETLDSDEPLFDPGAETFSGDSAAVTGEVSLVPALTVVAFEHDGDSNFIAELEGPVDDLVVNTIGVTTGAAGVATDRGDYLFDVDADGDWSLTVGQPIAPPGEIRTPSVSASGDGPAMVGPVELDEATTFTGEHMSDDGNFIVEVYNEEAEGGFPDELVFNEIGEFEGETRVDPAGVAWIDVEADGAWRLEIS